LAEDRKQLEEQLEEQQRAAVQNQSTRLAGEPLPPATYREYRADQDFSTAARPTANRNEGNVDNDIGQVIQQNRQLAQRIAALENERATARQVQAIKGRYPDFDEDVIRGELAQMSPDDQRIYDSPAGWESIYLRKKMQNNQEGNANQGPAQPGNTRRGTPHSEQGGRSVLALGARRQEELPQQIRRSDQAAMADLGRRLRPESQNTEGE